MGSKENRSRLVEVGSTIFVQACARMMSAAWIQWQMIETSTAPLNGISGIAYSMRFNIASDLGMAFELAIKSLAQGLSTNCDGMPQVRKSHALRSELWRDIPFEIKDEIDSAAQDMVCHEFGDEYAGRVLTLAEYLGVHGDFLDRTVDNRYAIRGERQWKSDHKFIRSNGWSNFPFRVVLGQLGNKDYVDGLGVLVAYWKAIMQKACTLRWEDSRCNASKGLAADRDEAWKLVDRAINQILGNIEIMT